MKSLWKRNLFSAANNVSIQIKEKLQEKWVGSRQENSQNEL